VEEDEEEGDLVALFSKPIGVNACRRVAAGGGFFQLAEVVTS